MTYRSCAIPMPSQRYWQTVSRAAAGVDFAFGVMRCDTSRWYGMFRCRCHCLNPGVDERLARHIAHLWIRDPLVVFSDRIAVDDTKSSEHFEVSSVLFCASPLLPFLLSASLLLVRGI